MTAASAVRALRGQYPGRFSADGKDLEKRIKSLAKGIGDVTAGIFLREMRGIWEKSDHLPSDLVVLAAHYRGIVPKTVRDREEGP